MGIESTPQTVISPQPSPANQSNNFSDWLHRHRYTLLITLIIVIVVSIGVAIGVTIYTSSTKNQIEDINTESEVSSSDDIFSVVEVEQDTSIEFSSQLTYEESKQYYTTHISQEQNPERANNLRMAFVRDLLNKGANSEAAEQLAKIDENQLSCSQKIQYYALSVYIYPDKHSYFEQQIEQQEECT